MQLNISQQMKMSQQMKLAPQMIQSMEILQLSVMELNDRIEEEMLENGALEASTAESEASSETEIELELEKAREEASETSVEEKELVVDSEGSNEADFERLLEMSADWSEDNVSAGSRVSSNRMEDDSNRQHDTMSNMVSRPQSLHEYLLEQFTYFECRAEVRAFAEYLIQNLDVNGRLQSSLPEMSEVYGAPISPADAEESLSFIRMLDPPGVGARNHRECLLLQVKPETPHRDVLVTLISSHLEDIRENRLPVIQQKTGYSIDTIKTVIDYLIHNLDPFPGQQFEQLSVQNVKPDVAVEQNGNGKYVVRLLDEYTPQLRISRYYIDQLRNNPDAKTKEYIKKKIESARWLIEAVEQRYSTLKLVAQSIVDYQTAFLDHGPDHIVPLKMQQVADVVGRHVTTVSRAVDDKWIETPRGLFPLKRFFGGGTVTADGEEVAWGIIRLKLQDIVDNEDKSRPLSDDALVDALASHGYKLARRTVTKYRKKMNIPSSRQRREY